jgi:hypothetical protein
MKTPEDEAFDELAQRQGAWGGGFPAKRKAAADKLHWSDCAVHNMPAYPNGPCDCGAMNDRQRLEAIVSVINKYLPPDGIHINEAMSEIISLVDPLPPLPAQEPDKTLLAFYQATNFASLVVAMEGHIEKLQGKLQANPHTAIDAWHNREMHRTATPPAPLPVQEPVKCAVRDCQNHMHQGQFVGSVCLPCYITPPQREQNFCERCGKRTPDMTTIHTCTPPQGAA